MLLAIDIGNTNITLGVFSETLVSSWRLSTQPNATSDEYGTKILDLFHYATLERAKINAVAVASVVPSLTSLFQELTKKYFDLDAFIIDENVKNTLPNLYDNPKEVGADRIVNAVAALERVGAPCLVVDFGTATTFDCITKDKKYAGGLIVPGPNLSAESLALHTAKLPRVAFLKPAKLIGKSTVESIQSGLYYGYVELVDGLCERLKKELGSGCKIISTGGLASALAKDSKTIKPNSIYPNLTLEGIKLIWERNRG